MAIYILLRRPIAPIFSRRIDDERFGAEATKLVRSLPLPDKTSQISAAGYASCIKRNIFLLKRKRYGGEFDELLASKDLVKSLSDASSLAGLPSVDKTPRAVILARFCILSCGFDADEECIRRLLEEQNRWRTLCYSEIAAMRDAFKFVLLESLASFYEKLRALAKCSDIATKYVSAPSANKKYASLVKSKLFLSLCAQAAGYKAEFYSEIYDQSFERLREELRAICSSIEKIERFDFSRFYSPLEIYDKYDVFSAAEQGTKHNFLSLAECISDRENLDEFLLAVRVDKYMQTASSGHMALKRFKLAGRNFTVLSQRRDISMLGTALSSNYFMDIYFRPVNRRFTNRSITKILEYENSFEPIYKFRTVNFGISTKGGKLRLYPRLPDGVIEADVAFEFGGVRHALHLRRGDENRLYIGNTRVNGVNAVNLGERPLDITLIVSDKDN